MKLLKEEKVVLCITTLFVGLMIGFNIFGEKMSKDFIYHSNVPNLEETFENLIVKENIQFEVYEEISNDISLYLEGEPTLLSQIHLDFSEVNNSQLGNYTVYAKYKKEVIEIPVAVVDTTVPEIHVVNNHFVWYMEEGETIEDVMNYVNVTVSDNYDSDLQVEEWIKELPNEPKEEIYLIQVKDHSGNESSVEVVITYEWAENSQNGEVVE